MVIIGDEILDNSANGFPSSVDTIRRNDMELVYKFSVKDGFFFVVCLSVGRGWMRNSSRVN